MSRGAHHYCSIDWASRRILSMSFISITPFPFVWRYCGFSSTPHGLGLATATTSVDPHRDLAEAFVQFLDVSEHAHEPASC